MSKQSDLNILLDLVSSHQVLVSTYLTNLNPTTALTSNTPLPPNPPNPLHVLRDAAKLLKAHTTKLSLLLINKPFTATAIQKVLREVAGTCLPAIMSAVDICQPEVWGVFLKQQVIARVRSVLREMDVCYDEVRKITNEELETQGKKAGKAAKGEGRDSLVSTGLVWEACDKIIELENQGIGGLAVKRAEEWRDMIKDAIEELKEWEEGDGDEEEDEEGDDEAGSDDDQDENKDKDDFEDMFSAANALPKNRPDLKERLATADDKLKKISMLYAAISKRRLKTFTPAISSFQKNTMALDALLAALKELPETVDDLASAFYDLETEEVDQAMSKTINLARRAAESVKLNWEGKEDEYTAWATKWLDVMK